MATRQKGLSPLERDLLKVAAERPGGMIWMSEESLDTLSKTYKAMLRLEKLALLERKAKAGLKWKVTKAGRSEITRKPG
jgi:hypothetical protein